MELIADYLCDEVKGDIKAHSKRLVLNLTWLWNKLLKRLLYDMVISVIANIIANPFIK